MHVRVCPCCENLYDADHRTTGINPEAVPKLLGALKLLEVHLGWGDCTLSNLHDLAREAIDLAEGKK